MHIQLYSEKSHSKCAHIYFDNSHTNRYSVTSYLPSHTLQAIREINPRLTMNSFVSSPATIPCHAENNSASAGGSRLWNLRIVLSPCGTVTTCQIKIHTGIKLFHYQTNTNMSPFIIIYTWLFLGAAFLPRKECFGISVFYNILTL